MEILPNKPPDHTAEPTVHAYSKTCLKRPLSKRQKIGFKDQLSLNAGQKYCRMLQGEHSAILSTFIKLSFVNKIFVWSILSGCFRQVLLYMKLDFDWNQPEQWVTVLSPLLLLANSIYENVSIFLALLLSLTLEIFLFTCTEPYQIEKASLIWPFFFQGRVQITFQHIAYLPGLQIRVHNWKLVFS